jgi:hypothetical protein
MVLSDVTQLATWVAEQKSKVHQSKEAAGIHPAWYGQATPVVSEQSSVTTANVQGVVVYCVLPADLSLTEQKLLRDEIKSWVLQAGWAEEQIVMELRSTSSEVAVLADVNQLIQTYSSHLLILLGGTSTLSQTWVDRMASQGLLMQPGHHTAGVFPGEAGVCMALIAPSLYDCVRAAGLSVTTQLHAAQIAEREKSIEERGRVDAACLATLLNQYVTALELDTQSIGGVVCSADYQPTRMIEVGEWLTHALSDLDCIKDVLYVGQVCGSLGQLSSLLSLALASQLSQTQAAPILVTANTDTRQRGLVLLTEFSPPELT